MPRHRSSRVPRHKQHTGGDGGPDSPADSLCLLLAQIFRRCTSRWVRPTPTKTDGDRTQQHPPPLGNLPRRRMRRNGVDRLRLVPSVEHQAAVQRRVPLGAGNRGWVLASIRFSLARLPRPRGSSIAKIRYERTHGERSALPPRAMGDRDPIGLAVDSWSGCWCD
jgi:hypothetical protein